MGVCVLLTLALRVPFLAGTLAPDEAGLLIVAREWHEGPFLYGDYFVGRGIVLVLVFKLADVLGGVIALRLLACVAAAALVISAGWAGHLLRGRRGAGWSALVAAAYASATTFTAEVMNERLVAATLVTVSCACTLAAVRRVHGPARPRYALAVLAGVTTTCAVLVVQSYGQGVVFAAVLLLGSWRTRVLPAADAVRIAGAGVLGMLLPLVGLTVAILTSWLTAAQLWFQMFGYRFRAVGVLSSSTDRPYERLTDLITVAAVTGVLALALGWLLGYRQVGDRRDLAPAWWAVLAMAAVAVSGMALGGDWWPDYLLELVPALVLATALVAPGRTWSGLWMRASAVLAAVATIVSLPQAAERLLPDTAPPADVALGQWLATGARDGDTAVVVWSQTRVLYEAGLTSPYPYLWSLLTRTLDPDLDLMLSTLRGPDAPTWFVELYDMNAWGLDESGDLAAAVDERYVLVGSPCGFDVYLLRTESREPLPADLCGQVG